MQPFSQTTHDLKNELLICYSSHGLNNNLLVRSSSHDLNKEPIKDQTGLDNLNTELFGYSDPCSMLLIKLISGKGLVIHLHSIDFLCLLKGAL